jgi:DNA-binding transcriptional LysR family regulator
LGTHHLPANFFIPDLIARVREKFPGFKVQMELGPQKQLLEKLFQQKLDLVLMIGQETHNENCRLTHLFDQEIALVTSSRGVFGAVESMSARDLGEIPLILQQKGTGALRAVLEFLKEHGVEPNILLENLSSDVIKQFLYKMPSGAFIGRFIVQKELDEGLLHEIKIAEGPPLARFHLAYMGGHYVPSKVKRFLAGAEGFQLKAKPRSDFS